MPNEKRYEPPFDGVPCPMCPSEIRNLSAVAHNLLVRWDAVNQHGGGETWAQFREKLDDLRRAVEAVRPLADAHFANSLHSHGTVFGVSDANIPDQPQEEARE